MTEPKLGTQLHVSGIGVHEWDGTEEGMGKFESQAALSELFSKHGEVCQATVRHKVKGEQNKSWALVTMGNKESADRALAATIMAGSSALVVKPFSNYEAHTSKGAMSSVMDHAKLSMALQHKHSAHSGTQLHVRGIGFHGWDGTDEGRGDYESEAALSEVFSAYGKFHRAEIHHRIERGKNTSWALVTMSDKDSADRILAAAATAPIMAGSSSVLVTPHREKHAQLSADALAKMREHSKHALRHANEASAAAAAFGSYGSSASLLPDSPILINAELSKPLIQWIRDAGYVAKELLYRASRDGWQSDDFHLACDGAARVLLAGDACCV